MMLGIMIDIDSVPDHRLINGTGVSPQLAIAGFTVHDRRIRLMRPGAFVPTNTHTQIVGHWVGTIQVAVKLRPLRCPRSLSSKDLILQVHLRVCNGGRMPDERE